MSASTAMPAPRRRLLAALAWTALGVPAWAEVDRPTAESLLRLSGLWDQFAGVAPQVLAEVLAMLAQRGTRPAQAEADRLSRAVDSAYSVHRLRSECLARASADLDRAQVAALRRWFEGPLGRTITRLEVAQSGKDPRAHLEQGAALLGKLPLSRRQLLEELALATRSAEMLTELTIGTALAVHQGAASVAPDPAAPSLRELKANLDGRRHQLMRAAGAQSLASFAATYATLPDADLGKYLAFIKSEAGQHFVEVARHAVGATLFGAAAELGSTLAGSRHQRTT